MASFPKPAAEVNLEGENENFNLPDDIVRKIVQNVPIVDWPKLELVSKQFQRCVQNAYCALKTLDLKTVFLPVFGKNLKKGNEKVFREFFTKLIAQCPLLQAISGFDCLLWRFSSSHFDSLSEFTELKDISFDEDVAMHINDLACFLKNFPRMKSFKFCNSYHIDRPNKNDENFDFFGIFNGLMELEIANLRECSGRFLSKINAENLKVLDFSGSSFKGTYVCALLKQTVNLGTLYLHDCLLENNNLEFQVLQCLPSLTKLHKLELHIFRPFSSFGSPIAIDYTSDDLRNILARCQSLRDIRLAIDMSVEIVTDSFLHRLIAECPLLEALNFSAKDCHSEEMVSNVVHLQHLKQLVIGFENWEILKGLFSKLHKLENLSRLTIDAVVEEAELVLLKNVKNLTIFRCNLIAITETVAKNWIEAGFLKKLTLLDVLFVEGIAKSVFKNAPNLREIVVHQTVDDETFLAIAECCKHLEIFDSNYYPVSEKGLLNLLLGCHSLRCVKVDFVLCDGEISLCPSFQPFKHVVSCRYSKPLQYY